MVRLYYRSITVVGFPVNRPPLAASYIALYSQYAFSCFISQRICFMLVLLTYLRLTVVRRGMTIRVHGIVKGHQNTVRYLYRSQRHRVTRGLVTPTKSTSALA